MLKTNSELILYIYNFEIKKKFKLKTISILSYTIIIKNAKNNDISYGFKNINLLNNKSNYFYKNQVFYKYMC